MAAKGYPEAYPKGMAISGLDSFKGNPDCVVFHAGTEQRDTKEQAHAFQDALERFSPTARRLNAAQCNRQSWEAEVRRQAQCAHKLCLRAASVGGQLQRQQMLEAVAEQAAKVGAGISVWTVDMRGMGCAYTNQCAACGHTWSDMGMDIPPAMVPQLIANARGMIQPLVDEMMRSAVMIKCETNGEQRSPKCSVISYPTSKNKWRTTSAKEPSDKRK